MPVIILLVILAIYGAANIYTNTGSKNTKAFTSQELDKMLGEMVGKSKKDARKVLRKYKK